MQRMDRTRRRYEAHPHERIAAEAAWNAGSDREVDLSQRERLFGPADNRFVELDSRLGMLVSEARQASQQQPGRKDNIHRKPQFGLPALSKRRRRALERSGLIEQRLCAAV